MTHILQIPNYHQPNHHHLPDHLTQFRMDPTLSSKSSPTSKYFFSPEPAAQDICKITHCWDPSLGSPLSRDIKPYINLQATYYYTDNLGIQNESPSLNRAILTCKLPPSPPPTHPTYYCTTSIIHPSHPLMQATYLHRYPGSILPFLNPNSQSTLQLWNFASPKFGFQNTSSLPAAANTMMYHSHNLPEGMNNISPEDLMTFTKTLGTTYSDDVLNHICLARISGNSRN